LPLLDVDLVVGVSDGVERIGELVVHALLQASQLSKHTKKGYSCQNTPTRVTAVKTLQQGGQLSKHSNKG
jgi:hypothetical protein